MGPRNFLERTLVRAEAKRVSDGLVKALGMVNLALEEDASASFRRGATRTVQRALRKLTEADLLWDTLVMRAESSKDAPPPDHAVLEMVEDLLTPELATVLVASGYRTPPPPAAYQLVEETIEQIGHCEPHPSPAHYVGSVRDGLREFARELELHMHSTDNPTLRRVLLGARAMTTGSYLLCVASAVEVKTGDAFGVDVGASIKDLQLEVAVPSSPAAVCAVIACGAAAVVGQAVARTRKEQQQIIQAEMAKRHTNRAQPVDSPEEAVSS